MLWMMLRLFSWGDHTLHNGTLFEVLVEGYYDLQVSLLHGSFLDVHVLGGWWEHVVRDYATLGLYVWIIEIVLGTSLTYHTLMYSVDW